MASLIVEYRKRHGLACVMSIDEGVTFFDVNKKPFAIAMTSSHSRSVTNCRECLNTTGGLIGELFVHTGKFYPKQTYNMIRHEHLEPDVDLCVWANKYASCKSKLEPFIPSSDRELECWLWQFFIHNNPIFLRKWHNRDEPMRSLEQIAWTIGNSGVNYKNNSQLFEYFYKNVYYTFLLGRRYTIYG